jgi:hypothetical protein
VYLYVSALAQSPTTAPAGHQAGVASRLIQHCRSVPRGIKQCTPKSTSSCTATFDGAHRLSGRRSAPSHPALPPGAPWHQAAHAREHQHLPSRPRWRQPVIRPTQCTIASGAAAGAPMHQTAHAREHQLLHCRSRLCQPAIRPMQRTEHCRPMSRDSRRTKQRTPRSTSSSSAAFDGAHHPSGRRGAPSHPALPPNAPRHQAAHAREHELLHSRPRRRPPAIRPTQRAVASGAAARCPEAPSISARQGAPAPSQPSPTALAGHQANAARRLIRRCRLVPRGTKQRTPESTSSCCTALTFSICSCTDTHQRNQQLRRP